MNPLAKRNHKVLFPLLLAIVTVLLSISLGAAHAQGGQPPTPVPGGITSSQYLTLKNVTLADGTALTATIIHGPPVPPAGFARASVEVFPQSAVMLTVPAFNWVFGCSAVSSSMIAGYYDRNGYPKMYTGPTSGGVMPLVEDASWGSWTDSNGDTYPNNPLIASHNGLDGRATKGSIDDYWVTYGSSASDPYISGSWTQHAWGSAIGDYMKTSQSAYSNTDGSTTFYNYTTSADKLTCADMLSGGISTVDGTYGRKLFYQSKGYTVTDCYSQKTDNTIAGGFSLANFKAQIDAHHPVLLNLAGHSIAGVGYDSASSTIYIHDTWDNLNHTMTWGGSYSGMQLLSVSVVNLASSAPVTVPTPKTPAGTISDTTPTYVWTKITGATQYRYQLMKGTATVYTKTVAASACGTTTCSNTPTTVLANAAYKWRVQALVGGAWKSYSAFKLFTVSNIPVPVAPSGAITDTTPTFTWTRITGATQYQFAVYTGTALAYPVKTVAAGACGAVAGRCSNTPTTVLKAGAHTWKVRAFVGGAWKAYSAAKAFSISAPSTKPKAGYWASTTGDEFYVNPAQTNVLDFAVYLGLSCGNYRLRYLTPVAISNNHFAFTGQFYGSGTFSTTLRASGQDGLNSIPSPCGGTVSGGPWSYTATWQDSTQPSAMSGLGILFEKLGIQDPGRPNLHNLIEIVVP